ncbi:spexin prohormone 1-like [Dunckerocampus dactyliophorus]|uniref:spexin prohormone 1-like n=1 Tax=Dunckerocampus dactyliophorus TaxID=161453 RepID=UPI0024049CB4|nr:spexin prohormone 1-like [Dunckerocampus dactyliophorus]
MSLVCVLLVVTLVSQCCSAPQRRNWTPQAMLYLKGTQGRRRSVDKEDTLHRATDNLQANDRLSWMSSVLSYLELIERNRDDPWKAAGRNKVDEHERSLK